jgi:O-antigen/teichoic acid export membrane protein
MTEAPRPLTTRRLVEAAGIYGAAQLAPRVIRLVLVPLVLTSVGLRVYGEFALLSMILPFAHVVCELGMGTAAMRIAPHEPRSKRASLFASLLSTRVVAATVVATLLVVARVPLAVTMTGSIECAPDVILVALSLVPFTLDTAFADLLRSEERHSTLASLNVVRDLSEAALVFALVVVSRRGLEGLLLARLAADSALLVLFAAFCWRSLRARPAWSCVIAMARIGVPIGALYFLFCVRDLDRYLVKAVLGVSDAGRYDLALRIVAPVALGNTALAMVLEPLAYRTFTNSGAGAVIATFLRAYVALFGTVAFAAAMISPEVFPILSPGAAAGAAVIAPSLVFAFVGDGVLRMAGIGADFAKRTGAWMVVVASHLLIAIPATWLLLRPLGIFAAGAALLAGTVVAAEVAYALSRRLYPLTLPVHRAVALLVVGAIAATLLVGGAGVCTSLVVRACAVPVFGLVAMAVTGFRPSDGIDLLRDRGTPPILAADAAPGGG